MSDKKKPMMTPEQENLFNYFQDALVGDQPNQMAAFQRYDELEPVFEKIRGARQYWEKYPWLVKPFLPRGKTGMPRLEQLFNSVGWGMPGAIPWLVGQEAKKLRVPMTAYYAGQGIEDKWIKNILK